MLLNPSLVRPSVDVLEPQFVKSKSFTQIHTLTAVFNDSSLIQVQFILTNLGISDRNGACKIIFLSGANRPEIWNKKYGKAEWSYVSDPDEHALRIGPNEISVQNGETRVTAGDDKMLVEVLFESTPEAVVPPDAEITVKGRFFRYMIPIRWMPARVKLKRKDIASRQLDAFAMLESSRSTSFPSDICRGWLTFRGYDAHHGFNANIRLPPPKEKAPITGWIWKSPDREPVSIRGIQLEIDARKRKYKMPFLRKVSAHDSSFIVIPREPLCRYSFIDELGPILGTIIKLVIGAPTVYYYRAEVKFYKSDVGIPGILEYMVIE